MKGGEEHQADWSSDSESLFQAARFDHEASAADKARVQEGIASRLSARAVETASAGQGGAGLGQRATQLIRSSSALRLVLGVLCVATVSTTWMLASERPNPQGPVDLAVSSLTRAGTTDPPTVESPRFAAQNAATQEGRATSAISARAQDTPHLRATQGLSGVDLAPTAVARPLHAPRSQRRAVTGSRTRMPSEVSQAAVSPAATERTASEPAAPVEAKAAPPSEPPERPARAEDARAELTLVERIQAALRVHDTFLVLELCSEHERRWPHGTFVEEREGIRALVACNTRSRNAESRARLFLAAYPHTPFAQRVAAACAVPPSATLSESTDLGSR
jgi:hypothetical protein